MWSLEGRSALVVGAGSSLGVPLAEALAERKGRVWLACHDPAIVERDVSCLRYRGIDVQGLVVDVTDAESCAAALRRCVAESDLCAVVNCASVSRSASLRDTRNAPSWKATLDVSLLGAIHLTSAVGACVPPGSTTAASIVHISSLNARIPVPGYAAYCAAKAGLESLVRVAAVELAPSLRVNCVAPGPLENQEQILNDFPGFLDGIRARHPLGRRLTSAADIVGAVLFLLGPDAAFVTGQTLVVDGGVGLNFGSLPNTRDLAARLNE